VGRRDLVTFVGRRDLVTAEKAERELGWSMRPVTQSTIDTGQSLIEHGVVPERERPTTRQRATA
jgi:hypothetical protein